MPSEDHLYFTLAQYVLGLLLIRSHSNTWWLKMTVISVQICNLDRAQRARVTSLQAVVAGSAAGNQTVHSQDGSVLSRVALSTQGGQ